MSSDSSISFMAIQDAVNQSGGNGLCSPAFQPPLDFLIVFGWQNVEQGVEALVCNGEVIPHTKLKSDFLRLIGRRSFFRRVLLKPAPLTIISEALSKDELKVSLEITVKYEVKDPVYVSSLQDPIAELSNMLEGVTAECIRAKTSNELVGSQGNLREWLLERLSPSALIKDKYTINDVLKVIPTIDELYIEVRRQTNEAILKKGLVDADGENRKIEAKYNLDIKRQEVELQTQIDQKEHERVMEKLELEKRAEVAKTAIAALGQVAGSGIDPTRLAREVIGNLVDPLANHKHTIQLTEGEVESNILPRLGTSSHPQEAESKAIESIMGKVGIQTFEIMPSGNNIGGAIIQTPTFDIIFKCTEQYPADRPEAVVRFSDGDTLLPVDYWVDGVTNRLAQAILAIIPQVNKL